jgi:DNA mismatch repair protein MutS
MQNDKITLKDLSVFTAEGGIFELLDRTTTQAGRNALRRHVLNPPDSLEKLRQVQDVVKFWSRHEQLWPNIISNGTLVMLEKFFESADAATSPPATINLVLGGFLQKLLNRNEYFFTQFSISHLSDFLKGCKELTEIVKKEQIPVLLRETLQKIDEELQHRLAAELISFTNDMSFREQANLAFKARREMKPAVQRLMALYAELDAWHSLAVATTQHKWTFPVLESSQLVFNCSGLYHPLLQQPVPYDVSFSPGNNFLLLTGANMSGKTTFMRALGVGALLAHLGAGVPASSMNISFLQGIITNMQVEDDITKGESYFFAEVQRMKQIALKLQQQGPQLVLMDELFKGTNVHDAYECTRAVVEGLLQHDSHLMVLSTHLYEVAQHFSSTPGLSFAYFITQMNDNGDYHFTYALKPGISADRLGYRILQKEGVLDLLKGNNDNKEL